MLRIRSNENSALTEMEDRIHRLESRNLFLFVFCASLGLFFIFLSFKRAQSTVKAAESQAVLHVKGLVIEDDQGRARILLGAPFPAVPERLRQDDTTSAMVFLDQQGHDRFAIGEKLPPQIDGRVLNHNQKAGIGYGLTLFDPVGNERGAMGFLSDGTNASRAVMVLDRPEGDAIGAIVDDKTGYAGLAALYPPREMGAEATGVLLGTQGGRAFLEMQDSQNQPRAALSVEPNHAPALQIFDQVGRPGPNLLHPADRPIADNR